MSAQSIAQRRLALPPLELVALGGVALISAGLLAAAPLRLALLLAGALVGGLALLRWPSLGLCLLGLTVPFGSLYELQMGGLTVGPSELLLMATLGAFTVRWLVFRRLPTLPSRLWLPMMLYALWLALSLLRATSLTAALKELAKWVELLLLMWVAASLTDGRWRLGLALGLLTGGALQGLLGIYQFLYRVGPEGFLLFGRYMRAYGTFLQPNPYGGYLGLLLPLAYGIAITALQRVRRERAALALVMVAAVCGAIMAVALVMSWSRGALLGAAAGAALVGLWLVRRSPGLIAALVILAVLLVPLASRLLPGGYLDRLAGQSAYLGQDLRMVEINDDNFATIERLAHWQAALEMFAQRPWVGVGAGQYAIVYPQVALPRWQDPLGHAHNYYLHTLAELGLVGLGLFVVVCVAVPMALWKRLDGLSDGERGLALGALGMWGHLLAHSLVDNLFVHEMYLLVALLIGVALAAAVTRKESAR